MSLVSNFIRLPVFAAWCLLLISWSESAAHSPLASTGVLNVAAASLELAACPLAAGALDVAASFLELAACPTAVGVLNVGAGIATTSCQQ